MSALTLEARFPVIVIAGDFNAAIFQPPWVAANLHGIEDGVEIAALEMLGLTPAGELHVTFIEGIGLNVTANRIEVFVFDHEPATLERLDRILVNFTNVLPHTPVRAIGCNLTFVDAEPEADVLALFDTPEGFEAEYQLRSKQLSAQIELDDGILNFARALSGDAVRFNFNYHRACQGMGQCAEAIPGIVAARKEQSINLLRSLYNYDEYETVTFASQLGKAENGNEAAVNDPVVENADGQD